MFKKLLCIILSAMMALSVCSVIAFAEEPEDLSTDLYVYDLLKYDVDWRTSSCKSIELLFQGSFVNFDETKTIELLDESGKAVATLRAHDGLHHRFDLYNMAGEYGVQLSVYNLYFIHIPAGTYTTAKGVPCDEYTGAYDGFFLTGNNPNHYMTSAGMTRFVPKKFNKTTLYNGRLYVPATLNNFQPDRKCVELYRVNGKNLELVGAFPIVSLINGEATVNFGEGVAINKYDTYVIRMLHGGVYGTNGSICETTDFEVSGKVLLGLREDIPWLDFLINTFGTGHFLVSAAVTVVGLLSKIKIVDAGYAKDIKNYVDKAKKNGK